MVSSAYKNGFGFNNNLSLIKAIIEYLEQANDTKDKPLLSICWITFIILNNNFLQEYSLK